jgi:1-acyl-sn-glycerol-3-phosphate acyltransferase
VILLANHQSHLDPVLVGVATRRPLSFLARKSLFRGPFGLLIRSLDAIPLDREGVGIAGLREVIQRLRQGEATLVFPEGTRTHDGQLGAFLPGFGILARRSGATIVPVGIDGAYKAWPRSRRLPLPARVTAHVGRPIPPETVAALGEEELIALVRRRIRASARVAATRTKRFCDV